MIYKFDEKQTMEMISAVEWGRHRRDGVSERVIALLMSDDTMVAVEYALCKKAHSLVTGESRLVVCGRQVIIDKTLRIGVIIPLTETQAIAAREAERYRPIVLAWDEGKRLLAKSMGYSV